MAKTPFIRPLQVQGGTFYAFSSAAEDLSFTFNNSVNKFKFSKFALLNIPDINSGDPLGNTIKLNAPDGAFLDLATGSGNIITGNANVDFSQSFQSYCLNIETIILSSDAYDSTLTQNISERIFFKWMKEIGAIRFQPASSDQVVDTLDQDTVTVVNDLPVTEKRYVEGDPEYGLTGSYGLSGSTYNRVVQYIGNLDIVNSVKNNNNTYSEIYVHVPTKDGNTPTVLFKNVVDKNYYPDYAWTNNTTDPLDKEYLTGRAYDELNPSGLTNLAIFDDDVLGSPTVTFEDTIDGSTGDGNWYSPRNTANTYYNDPYFTDPTSLILVKTTLGATGDAYQKYVRTRLDSIGIDFDPDSYKEIVSDLGISSLEEFNSTPESADFSFNAVLIYYDVYDPADPTECVTNLYGVLFLDDVQTSGSNIYGIPAFEKYKPNVVTKLNGNSYGLKLNIKFDVDIDQTGVEQAINDYSPFSLTMFMDAMNVLQDASGTLNDAAAVYTTLANRVSDLENMALSSDTTSMLNRRIEGLENSYAANQALFKNTEAVMGLINQNYELIRAIINNETSAVISYDLDSIKEGKGVRVDRTVENQVTISNLNQDYNISSENGAISLQNNSVNTITLVEFGNYVKHINNGTPITLTSDLIIRIDDTVLKWRPGQAMRFSFGDMVIPGDFNIVFVTDATGDFPLANPTNVAYSKLITSLNNADVVTYDYLPVIDIVCVNVENLIFQVDIVGKSLTNNG